MRGAAKGPAGGDSGTHHRASCLPSARVRRYAGGRRIAANRLRC